jgi:two-component system, cell cycle sensor histidine kinase and response regulator CckA
MTPDSRLRTILRRGALLLAAADGHEAVRLAQGHAGTIHVLSSDVVMPGMGADLLSSRC